MSASVQNLEEAAHVASEFISSLDNLPLEVQHLLGEIRYMDTRCQELQHEITKGQNRYIKYSMQNPGGDGTNTNTNTTNENGSGGNKAPDPALPARIKACYGELDGMIAAKITVARRLLTLLTITRSRLDTDLSRVRQLQGEVPLGPLSASYDSPAPSFTMPSSIPQQQQQQQLSAVSSVLSEHVVPDKPPPKKRRTNSARGSPAPQATPITIPSLTGTTPTHSRGSTPQARNASSRSRLRKVTAPPSPEITPPQDILVEEEDSTTTGAGNVEDEEEDTNPYCICQTPSYGEMIGCDGPDCPYQWFHLDCIRGDKTVATDTESWFCSECRAKMAGNTKRRR